jgi:outer membrane biosynthesis protein TonB
VTDTVTVTAPVDSAAVFAFYAKAHASKKGKHQEKHKKQGKVEVLVDSHPEEAMKKKIEGTVYALMTLDEQGNITSVDFPGDQMKYGFQKEARRVLMASPRWNPAKHAGTPVKAKFALPVTYDIKY